MGLSTALSHRQEKGCPCPLNENCREWTNYFPNPVYQLTVFSVSHCELTSWAFKIISLFLYISMFE